DRRIQQPDPGPEPRHRVDAVRHDRSRDRTDRAADRAPVRRRARRCARVEVAVTQRTKRRRETAWALIDLVVVAYALVPVLWIVSLSLKSNETMTDGRFLPRDPTLRHYIDILGDGADRKSTRLNSSHVKTSS